MADFHCLVCGGSRAETVEGFQALPRVTSDCKPFRPGGTLLVCNDCGTIQKLPDEQWLADIAQIYRGYEIYQLSDGAEQVIFTASGPVPRSKRLVEFLKQSVQLPKRGRLIDIGCGNGAALARFSEALPHWQLYGSELSDRALARLRDVPNFAELYTVPIDAIPGRFDVVAMIHSLEHMPSPRGTIEQAMRLLDEEGLLFVEVPDAETSPFDLLVADHLVHFSRKTLTYLAGQAGLHAEYVSNSVLPKEITLAGRRGSAKTGPPSGQDGTRLAQATVRWLSEVLASARELASRSPFGIFGTSISGMWLFGPLGEAVSFFVDEDPSKIGRQYAGKPILSPLEAPPGATVFVPLVPATAIHVAERYAHAPSQFVPAPAFTDVPVNR